VTVASILLKPAAEWRDRLMQRGPMGAVPPSCMLDALDMRLERTYDAGGGSHGWVCNGCGAWAQHVYESEDKVGRWRQMTHTWHCPHRALVLAWDGAVVPEGRDRAARVLAEEMGVPTSAGLHWIIWHSQWWLESPAVLSDDDAGGESGPLPELPPRILAALVAPWALATVMAARGMGRVVLLDSDGNAL